jgi:ribosomal protein S18 acetylase RimI-like enzyme
MIVYRLATVVERDKICALHVQSWRQAYVGMLPDSFLAEPVVANRNAVWQQRFAEPKANQRIVVAMDDQQLCGFVCVYGDEDSQLGTFIDNLHVDESYKGQGIGKELMLDVTDWHKQQHPGVGMYLEVLADNVGAQRFYQKLGATSLRHQYWDPPAGERIKEFVYVWNA